MQIASSQITGARLRSLTTAALAACAVAGLATEAQATQIDGEFNRFVVADASFAGLPPTNAPDAYAVEVATVNGESVWKLTTSSPIRAVTGTCTRISGTSNVAGPSEVHCRRGPDAGSPGVAPSFVNLGGGDDSFVAAPGFPDRLTLLGGDGNDALTGGIANDGINGEDGDNVLTGNDGDDILTVGNPPRTQFGSFPNGNNTMNGGNGKDSISGGDGNDTMDGGAGPDLLGGGRGIDQLTGGEGDDSLSGTEDGFSKRDRLDGGPGKDRFFGDTLDQMLARDGVREEVGCFAPSRFSPPDPLALVEVDLQDSVVKGFGSGAGGAPCPIVARAPQNERPSVSIGSANVKVVNGLARVSVRCATAKACVGKLSFRLDRKKAPSVSASYSIRGKRASMVSVQLGSKEASKVTKKGVKAIATLTEKGIKGARTVVRSVTAKR